jgi:hypothetical protein
MKQRQFNFLNMVNGVLAGFQKEQQLWEQEPEIVSLYNSIKADYDQVIAKGEDISGTDTTGYTFSKNDTFDRLTAATYKLARQISGYAKIKNDTKLLPLVDLSLTTISHGPEKEVLLRCAGIARQAESLLTVLAPFKVTAGAIAAIKQMVTECEQFSSDRTVASSGKVIGGRDIGTLISGLREKLDILDDLVEGLIDDDGFIARYKSLRVIIDHGKGKTLKNKVTEKVIA